MVALAIFTRFDFRDFRAARLDLPKTHHAIIRHPNPMKGETRFSRIVLHLRCIKNHIQGIYREIPTMTPVKKITFWASAVCAGVAIAAFCFGFHMASGIFGIASAVNLLAGVRLKNY